MAEKTNRKKNTGGGKKTAQTKAKSGGRRAPEPEPEDSFLPEEISILAAFAAAVLLFLSNFRLCGSLGEILRSVQLGVFGMIGFGAPILLFVGTCFVLANRGSVLARVKLIAVVVGVPVLCGLAELVFGGGYVKGQKLGEIYARSAASGMGGGALGGILVMGIGSVLGTIGAYLVLIALLVICGVCITEKSVVSVVKRGGDRAYQYAKEDADRRRVVREEKKEERRRLREEQKVRGVNLNSTKLEEPSRGYAKDALDGEDAREEPQTDGRKAWEKSGPDGKDAWDEAVPSEDEGWEEPEYAAAESSAAGDADMNAYIRRETYGPEGSYGRGAKTAGESAGRGPRRVDHGGMREFDPEIGNQGFMDELLPDAYKNRERRDGSRADVFTGNITRPPVYVDPDDDTVPFGTDAVPAGAVSGMEFSAAESAEDVIDGEKEAWPAAPDRAAGGLPQAGRLDSLDSAEWEEIGTEDQEDMLRAPRDQRTLGEMEVVDGSLTMEEGSRRVVTSTGKIIESDTEALQKKLESRRQEAREERFAGADAEAARSLGRAGGAQSAARGGGAQTAQTAMRGGAQAAQTAERGAAREGSASAPKPVVKKEYVFPPLSLLNRGTGSGSSQSDKEYRETAIKLQQTLRDFGVGVTVTNVSCGPSVTRYELHPEQGVKVSRIVGLADDIKLSLAAADIRIEAPIPGKSAVGIEVPNKEKNAVYLRELLESEEFKKSQSKLTFAVGKDIGGQVVVTDIAKMPHLLIAGSTGSGKSVCINTLIMSIIYKADPEDVKLIMVDPKVVELSSYNGIPHLLIPVVTDPKKASGALNWAVAEMDDRYKKFAATGVRDLKGYNAKVEAIEDIEDENKPAKLPQIVIIIDELADLMMVAPGEVEDSICRLAQLARAAGIHLVIATQRPSVNVITGLIKANVPSRIAFAVSSGVDSRTILDMVGAEKLLGKGDMLFYPAGMPKPQRVQGALVSDSEVSKVVDFLKSQDMGTAYSAEIENQIAAPAADGGSDGKNDRDEYFAQAGRFIIEKDKATVGMLQRMYKIGFNRAARIMDQLAEAGVVGEGEGTKPRKVLMTPEEFEALLNG